MSSAEEVKRLRVELITPDGPVFVDDARMVVVPGKAGELGVLPRHIPLIAQLKPGETRVRTVDDQWVAFATGAGYFKVQHDRASVLVERGRLYRLVSNERVGTHALELFTVSAGLALYSFTFGSSARAASVSRRACRSSRSRRLGNVRASE